MTTFKELGLAPSIVNSVEKIGFNQPTPIQEQAIPVALEGHDILGTAQTGTGKTASFMLPIISHLIKNYSSYALVLLPTRELSMQVMEAAKQMVPEDAYLNSALLIGGDSMMKQIKALRSNPRIVIGTPGRINDHIKRGNLKLKKTDFFVLDETDRMLDMGFGQQIELIANYLPEQRQTLMFSATMPKNIISMANKYLKDPVRINVGNLNSVATNIRQELVKTSDADKYPNLIKQISDKDGSTIIFVKTKVSADRLATKLNKEQMSADAIHGDLRQGKRQAIIANFRNEKFKILVATDVAARGLDIPHIQNVVNYDLPQCPEDYIHRIGRTARAGASGMAINLLTPQDSGRWRDIHKLLNPNEKYADDNDYQVQVSGDKRRSRKNAPKKSDRFNSRGGGKSMGKSAGGRGKSDGWMNVSASMADSNDMDRPARKSEGFGGMRKSGGKSEGFGGMRKSAGKSEGFGGMRKSGGKSEGFGGARKFAGKSEGFGGMRKSGGKSDNNEKFAKSTVKNSRMIVEFTGNGDYSDKSNDYAGKKSGGFKARGERTNSSRGGNGGSRGNGGGFAGKSFGRGNGGGNGGKSFGRGNGGGNGGKSFGRGNGGSRGGNGGGRSFSSAGNRSSNRSGGNRSR